MKLSENQLNTLIKLRDDKIWEFKTNKSHKSTLNSLYFKGLINNTLYSSGYFWEITDKGIDFINNLKL